ncbi:cytochrome b/b6 domain-containing protein [Metallumcola ferriviriculae]|uniref:Cytochrome b/b6 domain-containing protein n=1 Tax=Metallumcola ferriviriculae TaxID=3039180 RepID=A0AAU0UND3_9FIRM|nr:cytochrome b/b6 domain-containing protein [Desulfitibacteraceae bacterium MK1]
MFSSAYGKRTRKFERFNIHQRIQHIMMFVSFFMCTFTGLPIKYNHSWWAPKVTALFGGFDTMFTVHLIGAAIMLASSAYHLFYLIIYPIIKKQISIATVPALKDVRDINQHMRYLLGLTKEKARFDRYSYKEKFDYWAVFWGIFIMGGSGLMMWFPSFSAGLFPRWLIESTRIAHSDEAMLAILAIFIWHFYNVHFSPDFFPMNFVWFHGKMSHELMEHEHPAELNKILEKEQGANEKKDPKVPEDDTSRLNI